MATADYILDNATGANFRSDLNSTLAAIVSNNSSSTEPSTKYAYQWWADTNEGVLKIRNSANDGWVTLLQLDGTLTLEDGSNTAPALGFRDDLNTGIFSSAADTLDVTCGGTTRGSFSSSGLAVTGNVTATTFVGNIDAVDGDFDGTLEADAITVAGTALATVIAGTTVTTATNASHVSVADNESTNENNLIPFIEDASATGNVGLESDGDLHYNPSTGTVTATKFVGDGSGLTNLSSSGTTINGNTNNQVITATGTANTVQGESNLIFDGSNLGIRTTPSHSFHLSENGSSTTMRIENANADFLIQAGDAGDDGLHIYDMDNSAYRVMVDNSGNVGIGITTSLAAKLHVNGSITSSSILLGGTGSANELSDYEEGTWTATINVGTFTGFTTLRYTKIGNFVKLNGGLIFNNTSSSTEVQISGLPFAGNGDQFTGTVWLRRTSTGNKPYVATIGQSGASIISYQHFSNGNDMGGFLAYSDFQNSSTYNNFSISYFTNS